MNIFEPFKNSSVCAVFSHPDDVELLCYGTLAKLKELGFSITILIVTSGKHGVAVADKKPENLELTRISETKIALAEITKDIQFLGIHDGSVQFNGENVSKVESVINLLTPSIVLTHFTDQSGIDHQDHQIVSKIVKNICFRKSFVKLFLVTEPLKRGTGFNPNLFIKVGKFFQEKLNALSEHKSQLGRIYMTEPFHLSRSSVWQNHLGLEGEDYVESFMIEKAVL